MKQVEAANATALEKLKRPDYLLYELIGIPEGEQKTFWTFMQEGVNSSAYDEIEKDQEVFDVMTKAMIDATQELYLERPSVLQPARRALALELPTVPPLGTVPSWYRGED
jgi:hypothetical protein